MTTWGDQIDRIRPEHLVKVLVARGWSLEWQDGQGDFAREGYVKSFGEASDEVVVYRAAPGARQHRSLVWMVLKPLLDREGPEAVAELWAEACAGAEADAGRATLTPAT